jgi:hypothetical protein
MTENKIETLNYHTTLICSDEKHTHKHLLGQSFRKSATNEENGDQNSYCYSYVDL